MKMEDVAKLSKYYMHMTQFWYLEQESISTIVTEFDVCGMRQKLM